MYMLKYVKYFDDEQTITDLGDVNNSALMFICHSLEKCFDKKIITRSFVLTFSVLLLFARRHSKSKVVIYKTLR